MAINSNSLAEMEVPESYLDSLPKVYHAFFPDQNTCHVLFPLHVLVPTLNMLLQYWISEWKGNLRRHHIPLHNV